VSQWILSPDKGERLLLVPGIPDGFRATVNALRSRDGSKGVSFHTFCLKENRLRLLVKTLGRQMPGEVVREELEALGICVQGVFQHCPGRHGQEVSNACP